MSGDARVSGRFNISGKTKIDFEIPRIEIDSTESAKKLVKLLSDNFKVV